MSPCAGQLLSPLRQTDELAIFREFNGLSIIGVYVGLDSASVAARSPAAVYDHRCGDQSLTAFSRFLIVIVANLENVSDTA
jgi:hypothetical protein